MERRRQSVGLSAVIHTTGPQQWSQPLTSRIPGDSNPLKRGYPKRGSLFIYKRKAKRFAESPFQPGVRMAQMLRIWPSSSA